MHFSKPCFAIVCWFMHQCVSPQHGDTLPVAQSPDIVLPPDEDKEMKQASDKALKSVEEFIRAFNGGDKSKNSFHVKIAIRDGKSVEQFLVHVTKYDGTNFDGTINIDPKLVKSVKNGSVIKVDKNKVLDWMYVKNYFLVGGYTIRLERSRLSPEAREAFDASLLFKVK